MVGFNVNDQVVLRPKGAVLWIYDGYRARIRAIGTTDRRMGPPGTIGHAIHKFVMVYTVAFDDPKNGPCELQLEQDDLAPWNGLDEMLGMV
jgi:hypothetical protein